MNYGDRYTENKISAVNRELRKTFRTAQKELKKKLADFEKRFAAKNKQKKLELEAGKISKQDYQDWLTGQVFIRNQWQANLRQVCKVMHDANNQTMNIINNSRFDVFAENYNFNAWQAEKAINVSFNMYNAESVARLMTDDPQLLPEWKIDEEKDYIWNYNRVNNIVRQGIIQGEGIPEITDRLCSALATSNEAKMRMFARTALGAAQSAGRQKQMEDAAAMGIEVNKGWRAAHDQKTRDAHRDLDGQEVPYNKPFKSKLGDIMYPKDPKAHPANVFGCRCTMVTIYPKYEDRSVKYGDGVTIDGQSYEEWKKGKKARGEVQPTDPKPGEPSQLEKKVQSASRRGNVVEGKNIADSWQRRPNEYQFDIQDVINAQGFDGKPQVVSPDEFEKAVKESGFVAQRTYTAPTEEILNYYREQLYNGEWYVDCSEGGAQYGKGMYCAADYNGVLTDGIKNEMEHYRYIGKSNGNNYAYTETITLVPNAKILTLPNGEDAYEYISNLAVEEIFAQQGKAAGYETAVNRVVELRNKQKQVYNDYLEGKIESSELWQKSDEFNSKVNEIFAESGDLQAIYKNAQMKTARMDAGAISAMLGYDAINAEGHGESGSYTVILNRTKCIFRRDVGK